MLRYHSLEQPFRLLFDQAEYEIEVFLGAIIRVRHIWIGGIGHIHRQAPLRPSITAEKRIMSGIHGKYIIELEKIIFMNLARPQIPHVHAPGQRCGDRAAVRRLSDMVAVRTGRIYAKPGLQPPLPYLVPENGFGGRGATDVSRTDKQNAKRL